jgi:3-hydroxybutyryl-CoA dehydratase
MNKGDTYSHTFTVSEEVYQGFISIFQDRNILHTDAEYARSKGFEGVVMQGNILNGFLSYFIGELLPVKNVIIHSQEIKYSKPVYLNDTLDFHAEVADVFESVKATEFKYRFEKEGKAVAKGKIQIGLI